MTRLVDLLAQQLAANVQLGNRMVGREVLTGIRDASLKTGVDFAYMLAKANQESGFKPDAANQSSSARGLFQFTRQTWLEMVRAYGPKHGLGDVSREIVFNARGQLRIADPATEASVLALREDPRLSAIMAAEYAVQNKQHLERALGRPASTTDLYLAHFLGPNGATAFISAANRFPDKPAADLLPDAASQNTNLFYDGNRPRTLAELHRLMHGSIHDAMRHFAGTETITQGPPVKPPSQKPTPPSGRDSSLMGLRFAANAPATPTPPSPQQSPPQSPPEPAPVMAAARPIPPGPKPEPPPPEDMGAPVMADAGPPRPPGAKPDLASLTAPPLTPAPSPAPSPASQTVVAQARARASGQADGQTVVQAIGRATGSAENTIARVLAAGQAIERAGAARGLSLPGGSAAAVAALLDSLTEAASDGDAKAGPDATPGTVRTLGLPPLHRQAPTQPATENPETPETLAHEGASVFLSAQVARADISYMALAQTARSLFAPDAAPWPTPQPAPQPASGGHADGVPLEEAASAPGRPERDLMAALQAYGSRSGTPVHADAGQPTPTAPQDPSPAPAFRLASAEPAASPERRRAPPPDENPPSLRAAPARFLNDAEAARAIAAILGRPRSS